MPSLDTPCHLDPWDLASLSTADLFLLQSVRLWRLALARPDVELPASWQSGFLAAGIGGDGALAFERTLRALVMGARPDLRIHGPCCRRVARDEALILGLVAALQGGRANCAFARLRRRWPDTVARTVMLPLSRLAAALSEVCLECGGGEPASGLVAMNEASPPLAAMH